MMKILIFPLLFTASLCHAQQYRNLVLEGGGVRGLAYAGAYQALEQRGVMKDIENIAGSSAGSIAGLMMSVGYTAKEVDSIMRNLRIQSFNDGNGGILGKIKRFNNDYGIYYGRRFEKWVAELIKNKTGSDSTTFKQLHEMRQTNQQLKDFYCTGTNLTKQRVEIFSWKNTPDMMLKTAVRISGSIPLYYKPVILDSVGNEINKPQKGGNYNYYVDGGMLANFPISIFDSCIDCACEELNCALYRYNPHTLGLKLERPEQIPQLFNSNELAAYPIQNRKDYLGAFFNLMQETLQRKSVNREEEKGRTIYISQGHFSAEIKKMSTEEKDELFSYGKKAVEAFFSDKTASHQKP